MRRAIVRHTVKPGQEGVNEKPVRVVYDELHQTQPKVAAFRRFTDGIAGRCEIPPQTVEADQIGSYRLFCKTTRKETP